ncbi:MULTISPECIES: phycobiliprotein lyase [Moorena]|uniref:Chromophore lyase CpcS/CpeS n=1 Tax=Moorena producens 3L TaxID=489825 RepID=F4XSA5_9CYAN|nr:MULTISPECIES: phycobiliprotein lyase [Moorena]EGJ32541.1 CpeS-like protein [Moorena producens 3L]NEP37055.1 phycobiliprotein lyase [Moorena sp. SIO3B2]NEP64102.1 phycobiliprotein lyase [Moorena sp. SIO3A5]NEQ09902.1 phycobiliprotein lyase [Moorena sp. SIO4E2]NER89813.1 phycobiliprotein lyase [Moorena sp. SIO3A2]
MSISKFKYFFDCCVGTWVAQRTYHNLTHQEVERSLTEFTIEPLSSPLKTKVLIDNQQPDLPNINDLCGYHLGFETVSEKGERVSQQLNMLFVPQVEESMIIEGDYLRDRAYEEAKPKVAHFSFDTNKLELLMTTYYTRVVSVDSITLINPNLRIRKIINYQRPPESQPLDKVVLVGFGVEQKA